MREIARKKCVPSRLPYCGQVWGTQRQSFCGGQSPHATIKYVIALNNFNKQVMHPMAWDMANG